MVKDIPLSNPDKVLYPDANFTKAQVARYYRDVAPYLLPHLKNRPVTMKRYPDGVTGPFFYEKNAPRFTPDWVKTVDVPRESQPGVIRYILINDVSTLVWCANLASLEIHPFLHRAKKLDSPTSIVFDLDPGEGMNLLDCARVALEIRELLAPAGLECFPKVSGSKGIQLHLPLNTSTSYSVTTPFAHAIAEWMESRDPGRIVSKMAKQERRGKVFIDWSQNNAHKTTVSVYSLRAKGPRPSVSMPVSWQLLEKAMQAKKPELLVFGPEDALQSLAQSGDLYEPVLRLKQKLPRDCLHAIRRGA